MTATIAECVAATIGCTRLSQYNHRDRAWIYFCYVWNYNSGAFQQPFIATCWHRLFSRC